jgi:hypothetical protein
MLLPNSKFRVKNKHTDALHSSTKFNMNRFSKLSALEKGIDVNEIINSPWDQPDPVPQAESKVPEVPLPSISSRTANQQHLYDGTDSEDDEIIMSRGKSYHSVITANHEPQVFDASKLDSNLHLTLHALIPFISNLSRE